MNPTVLRKSLLWQDISEKFRIMRTNIRSQFLRSIGVDTIHCLGDSHTEIFRYIANNYNWQFTRFEYCIVHGASAMGLANPKSRTNALAIFNDYLSMIPKRDSLLFSLGEVDCGFVIWYRAQKYGYSVKEQYDLSLKNYLTFIDYSRERELRRDIIVCSTPLPTIQDEQDWGEVVELRKEVKATLRERTLLTIEYNARLRSHCSEYGYRFLDLEASTLDPITGTISNQFRNSDPFNHHLDEIAISSLIEPYLREYGYR